MLDDRLKKQLLKIARDSITLGLQSHDELRLKKTDYDKTLSEKRATFVTLHRKNQLRGCIGTLEPVRPLAEDVAHNAYAAAFSDRRFHPLIVDELAGLDIHISILDTPETISFTSEEDLIRQIRPGVDGLILEDGHHRGTFLPSVWESIRTSRDFLRFLKQKAGLPENYWSDSIKIQRYTVEEF